MKAHGKFVYRKLNLYEFMVSQGHMIYPFRVCQKVTCQKQTSYNLLICNNLNIITSHLLISNNEL